jgi:hypothetical protein
MTGHDPCRVSPFGHRGDHGMRAPPRRFSQLTTSFFADPCLGIHRAPLFRLTGSSSHPVHHLCSTHTHTCSLSTLPFFPQYPDCQFAPAQQRPDLPGRLTTHQGRPHGRCCVRVLGRDARCRPALDSLLAFCPRPRRRRTYSLALKGGDPAAGSPTATLLRLRPSHQARLRPLRPLAGSVTDFGRSQLPWRDGRCVQGPGTYSPWCS